MTEKRTQKFKRNELLEQVFYQIADQLKLVYCRYTEPEMFNSTRSFDVPNQAGIQKALNEF